MDNTKQPVEHIFCNQCLCKTRHEILASARQDEQGESQDGWSIDWYNIYRVLQCRGCGNVTYHTQYWSSEEPTDEDDVICVQDTFYPPLTSHPQPKWVDDLDGSIQRVLTEVYTAFHHKLKYLTAVGARTALDMVIVDKIGDIGNFQQKIKKLQDDGHITNDERDLIETLTETGNAAAHRGYAPSIKSLDSILKILESLLHKFYIQEAAAQELLEQAQKLKSGVPKRNK
jgi:hypothetical protein